MSFEMKGNNAIVGFIPNSLGKLKNLESLRLGMYMMTILIYKLSIVIYFNIILIENNQLEGPIPLTLGDINGLREFIASEYFVCE